MMLSDCPVTYLTGGPYDGADRTEYFENCLITIFAGGINDGFGVDMMLSDCPVTYLTGGPYDGADRNERFENCLITIFAGGFNDGFGVDALFSVCSVTYLTGGPYDGADQNTFKSNCTPPSIFSGGPNDGFGTDTMSTNCPLPLTIYAGGTNDGFGNDVMYADCPVTYLTGGPYDGADRIELFSDCEKNIFVGGFDDGFGDDAMFADCPVTYLTGGPYDGADRIELFSDCEKNIFAGGFDDGFGDDAMFADCPVTYLTGGPYDGSDRTEYFENCLITIFAGGPNDGFGDDAMLSDCPVTYLTGGPYDGADRTEFISDCAKNIFAGGPDDGFADDIMLADCAVTYLIGGPYDGADVQLYTDNCIKNIFAGGPYDGFADDIIHSFDVYGDTICVGQSATLTTATPSNWFATQTGGVALATNATSFTTPRLSQTTIYWVESVCAGGPRRPVIATVNRKIRANFTYVTSCLPEKTFFYNRTIISGPPTPSIGTGRSIFGLGTTGLPPGPGQLSFSSAAPGTLNFANMTNNIHDNGNAWTGGNSAASTQWIQWNYITPASVRRFYFWNNASFPTRAPRQIRLYYFGGSAGWILIKLIIPPHPNSGVFDTGIIPETNGTFANRWKIEVDVDANGPSWGEFQIFESYPTIGGTVRWDLGDGTITTVANPDHTYPYAGSYRVELTASQPGLCDSAKVDTVNICDSALPAENLLSSLNAVWNPKGKIDLIWKVKGIFDKAALEKLQDDTWKALDNFDYQASASYITVDEKPIFGGLNSYRVRYFAENGQERFSNIAEVLVNLNHSVSMYPNPTANDHVVYKINSAKRETVTIEVFSVDGKRLVYMDGIRVERGDNEILVNLNNLSAGVYLTRVIIDDKPYPSKLVIFR